MQGEEAFQESVRSMRNQTLRADRAGDYWTDDEKNRLRILFDSGVGITEIALELGRTEPAVYQQIEKWTCTGASRIRRDRGTARSLPSAYVTAVWLIQHCVRSGYSAA